MHLILIDGNCLGFSAMGTKRLVAGSKATHGVFNYIKSLRKIVLDNPDALVMVLWDGFSWRKTIDKEYKANREKTEKQIAEREEYYKQKEDILLATETLGVFQAFADNMEADDLAEIYTRKWTGDKVTLITADKDWLQLVDEKVTWYDPINERQCNHLNFCSFTNCLNKEQFLETKYILGDTGDNIKGVKGVGQKTLEKIYLLCPSLVEFLSNEERYSLWKKAFRTNMPSVLDRLDVSEVLDVFSRNETLMSLTTISRPEPKNLRLVRKPLDAERFEDLCNRSAFMSFTRDLDAFLKPFRKNKYVV